MVDGEAETRVARCEVGDVLVGGLGRLKGAVIAALGLGIIQAFVELSLGASLAKVAVLLLIVAFLQFRPQGLVQVRTRSLA